MLFSSVPFLYYFLPCVLAVYFLVGTRAKNAVLLVASLLFYFWGEPIYTLLLLASTLSAYLHGLLIDRYRGSRASRAFLISSIVSSVALLGFFKYSDFLIQNVNLLTGASLPLLELALPIGISFYTFQTLSYTIDVYRGDARVQKSFVRLATYVALFPQLIAGPIVRYTTVEQELSCRTHSFENVAYGISRFCLGLAKKVLIADQLGAMSRAIYTAENASVGGYWLYAVGASLQLYFDFSGYSDMAIGLGRVFGFHFLENFNYPYISRSIGEFWRRWHISLGSWFRDYVYISMGGNRVRVPRWLLNTLTVWFLTGFWHGADWTFIIWGLYFALLLVLEKFWLNKLFAKIPRVLAHIYVLFLIVISFVIFNANGVQGAIADLGGLFGAGGIPLWNVHAAYYLSSYAVVLACALLGATPLPKAVVLRLKQNAVGRRVINALEPVVVVTLLLVVTAYFVDGSFSPFLYFRF